MAQALPQAPPVRVEPAAHGGQKHGKTAKPAAEETPNGPHASFHALLTKAQSGPKASGNPVKTSHHEVKLTASEKHAEHQEKPRRLVLVKESAHAHEKKATDPTKVNPADLGSFLAALGQVPVSAGTKVPSSATAVVDHGKPAAPVRKAEAAVLPVTLGPVLATPLTPPRDPHHKPQVVFVDARTERQEHLKRKAEDGSVVLNQPVAAQAHSEALPKPNDGTPDKSQVPVTFQNPSEHAKQPFSIVPQPTQPTPRDAATFQQWLVDKGYGQLVDQARIVLKDQNAGEIRMTLYPESLGKVKVSLNLTDSSLAGHIFVENQTVKDVFQSNLNGLVQSFRDGGWNTMSLQVSVGNGGGGGQAPSQGHSWNGPRTPEESLVIPVTSRVHEGATLGGDRRVNLTA